MDKKSRLRKSFEGTAYLLLSFLAGSRSYFFFLIVVNGQIVCGEPNRSWLVCELLLTLAVAVTGIFLFVCFLRRNKSGKER